MSSSIAQKFKNIGPGALVAAGFIGPGTVTTCTVSGASYGYTMLWALLFATVATITFLNCWNDLLLGLVLISTPARKTLSMTISALKGSYVTQYGLLCAGFVISIVPVVFMYLLFQKQVIAGMTAGAVKG